MEISSALTENSALPTTVPVKLPLVPLIITVVVAVSVSVIALGGALFFLFHSHRFSLQKTLAIESKPVSPIAPPAAHDMALDPIVTNLTDIGGTAYLKMALTLRIADDSVTQGLPEKTAKPAKGISDSETAVRDTVLMVAGRQAASNLLMPDGKEMLKSELKTTLAERNPEVKVMNLYFRDFLVQR